MLGLLFALFLVLGNGFFVAAEFALVKVRSTQLDLMHARGDRLAGFARNLVEHLDGYLSATQLGITLTSLGLGWVGEPAVARLLEPLFHWAGLPDHLLHQVSLVVGFSLISFLHIVVGEVAPKSLAIARPVPVVLAVSIPMRVFYVIFWPALVVLNASSNALLRAIGVEPVGGHDISMAAEELRQVAAESTAGGQIARDQGDLLSNVFTFSDRVAHEIMIPRNKMHVIDLLAPPAEALKVAFALGHSRYPVVDRDVEHIVGVVHLKDVLPSVIEGTLPDLRSMARKALFIPGSLPAQRLLLLFQRQRTHLAFVLDEFGSVAGIVTLEDVLEELVGDIQDEHDAESPEIEPLSQGGWSIAGAVLLDELAALLGEPAPDVDASTVQGWLMESLGRVPRVGDEVPIGTWRAVVREMDQRSVERVEIRPPPEPEDG